MGVLRRTPVLSSLFIAVGTIVGFTLGTGHARATSSAAEDAASASRAAIVAEVKRELATEMGLVPVALMRDRRQSFVELYASDSNGKTHYGTAGYLGNGYFITVKHAVMQLTHDDPALKAVRVMYMGVEVPAQVVDAGDAKAEVDRGDWAILKSKDLDLPALHPDFGFAFDFAEPIFRLGNDYSRGIILSSGFVGQRTDSGLVTCLIDGHPGTSGGGVLNRHGDLVGIPIGRLEGDYRFSFLLPLRPEMLRKVRNVIE